MTPNKHFLSLHDLSADKLRRLLARAIELKALRAKGVETHFLRSKVLAMIFEKASTRTRVSFEVGMFELGGHAVHLSNQSSQVGRGEPIEDTARVLSSYSDCILLRTYAHERLQELAKWSRVPVINGLTDLLHPCQLLADLQTILELRGSIDELKYAWVGDGNNMAHSWIHAAAILGFDLTLACPPAYQPDPEILRKAKAAATSEILLTNDPKEAAHKADVIATDVWASMGQEHEAEQRRREFADYCVDNTLVELASPEVNILHCLPAHRGEEISAEVFEGPRSAVWMQAENRLHSQKREITKST
jgi:ornithine carbamoyltransferase